MTRPSFQFYPGDWQANSNLRRCTHAEKGVWIDVMCLLHDSEEYGVLRWPLREIAQAIGAPLATLRAIVSKGVLKGADDGQTCAECIYVPRSGRRDGDPVTLVAEQEGPIWYSSRMVKDEYVRTHAGASTRFGTPQESTPSHPHGERQGDSPSRRHGEDQGDGSSSSSSSSSSEKQTQRASRFDAQAHLVSLGVDQTIAADWLKTRKGKRLAPTRTSLDRVAAEAAKAGMSMAAAVKLACENGWGGFKAEWLADSSPRANGRSSDNPFA
ncbi:Uncharacterised protein [Burkholderia pseudomallei]|uniref:hypothetical protein n=1 Tax=Burkholderia pseudomallei TaxID=28450 RepID=UPI00097733BB|nr:hypothetical protein [Burkholderia pseudomallei]MBO2974548.1 hypothetical protein [Burkholderia pseudomallei]MBO7755622.1 hypothetical protein [Burkholderia pseudomallei]MBO7820530.1 hypothetical protein [Burkholderia pseudomallei]MBO7856399.1 hypothetical protein [Burkholderia pseudomallei]MBO7886425.1 hypothetical protein [Burkholderia pseudomallei]